MTKIDNAASSLDSNIAKKKQKTLLKMNLKSSKHLIGVFLLVRATLKKKMVCKII